MCTKIHYCNRRVDECLRPLIDRINSDGQHRTMLSCCGHSRYATTIIVLEKATGRVFEWFTGMEFPRRCKNGRIRRRYYVTDEDAYYFIPQLIGGKKERN